MASSCMNLKASSFQPWGVVEPSAHGTPAFFVWHRKSIRAYETALTKVDPSVQVPDWNWSQANEASPTAPCPFPDRAFALHRGWRSAGATVPPTAEPRAWPPAPAGRALGRVSVTPAVLR
ncbi:tyrosinase family protein [Streptomyces sp. NPDC005828]|uniref:tyrosinase family protein n=1 Tax=Streptomyces sp. NPDC005828 TaxID=3157071 RepID=UPI0033ED1E94